MRLTLALILASFVGALGCADQTAAPNEAPDASVDGSIDASLSDASLSDAIDFDGAHMDATSDELSSFDLPPDDALHRVSDRILQPGACTNVVDERALRGHQKEALRACATQCAPQAEGPTPECISACLTERGFTPPCADCYEALDTCYRAECPQCAEAPPLSPTCACASQQCAVEFDACAGTLVDLGPSHTHGSPSEAPSCTRADQRYAGSEALREDAAGCSTACGDDEACWASCLSGMAPECTACVARYDRCSALWCPADCADAPFSGACTDCARACQDELRTCLDAESFAFAAPPFPSAQLRIVLAHESPPVVSLLSLPEQLPIRRLLRTRTVHHYTTIGVQSGLALSAGAIGPAAELLAHVDTPIQADGVYTAVAWRVGSVLHFTTFEDDLSERGAWRLFNGTAHSEVRLVSSDAPHTEVFGPTAPGELSDPANVRMIPEELAIDLDGDGVPEFRMAPPSSGSPQSENVTLWLFESSEQPLILVSMSRGASGIFAPQPID